MLTLSLDLHLGNRHSDSRGRVCPVLRFGGMNWSQWLVIVREAIGAVGEAEAELVTLSDQGITLR